MELWITGAAVAVVFALIAAWQKRIDRAERRRALEAIDDARERGSHRAVAQYPHIEPFLCIGCGSCIKACPEDAVIALVGGVARVVNGSRCVGHAKCEAACPVGAIAVGLGDVSRRPDIPVLSPKMETTVPGVFIAGELAGIALIRNAVEQGRRVIDEIAARCESAPDGPLDVVIVGAGPAGLSAGLRAVEKGLRHLVIDQDDLGGTIRKYPRRKMTLVQEVDIPLHGSLKSGEYQKEDLIRLWETLVRGHAVALKTGVRLAGLKRNSAGLELETSAGPLAARHVVLALGRRGTPRKLGVPGEELEKVLYQLVDAATYSRQKVLVVGGGDSAVEAATGLANQSGNDVALSYRGEKFTRLKKRNGDRLAEYAAQGRLRLILSSDVTRVEPRRVLLRTPAGETDLENDYVFVFAGGEPPFALLKQAGIGFGGDGADAGA